MTARELAELYIIGGRPPVEDVGSYLSGCPSCMGECRYWDNPEGRYPSFICMGQCSSDEVMAALRRDGNAVVMP